MALHQDFCNVRSFGSDVRPTRMSNAETCLLLKNGWSHTGISVLNLLLAANDSAQSVV